MKFLVYRSTVKWLLSVSAVFFLITSCQKDATTFSNKTQEFPSKSNDKDNGHLKQTKTFSSDVVIKWLNLDQDLIRLPLPAGTSVQGGERILAYSGIALYETVVNGMPAYRSLSGQLTDFPACHPLSRGKPIIGQQVQMLLLQK
jgi:hypothetical protein